jgi:hypothetical protein
MRRGCVLDPSGPTERLDAVQSHVHGIGQRRARRLGQGCRETQTEAEEETRQAQEQEEAGVWAQGQEVRAPGEQVGCRRAFEEDEMRIGIWRLLAAAVLAVLAGLLCVGVAWGKPSEHPFEIVPGSFHFTPTSMQAGSHGDWVTSFDFAHDEAGESYNDARNIQVGLPAGFDASDTAVPTCTQAQLLSPNPAAIGTQNCPIASQVGMLKLVLNVSGGSPPQPIRSEVPLYNMEVTSFGTTAELGYTTALFTGYLRIQVRPQDDGLTSTTIDIPPTGEVHGIEVTVWGAPAASEHDALRGATCEAFLSETLVCRNAFGSPQPARIPVKPFLSDPTNCSAYEASMKADSWENPGEWTTAGTTEGPIEGCDRVPFEPEIDVQPSTRATESPSGLEVSLLVPQTWENPITLSTSNLKDTKVVLPEGMTANPGLAAGLGACTPQQYAEEKSSTLPGEGGCPPESKIGSIEIETPLLNEKIDGAVYIATPYDNEPSFGDPEHPGGSLLALYVVARDPERGVLIKVAGKIEPDPVTGRLTTTFLNTPQQPFSRFTLKFRPGATAPLASPPTCGIHTTQAALTPWSAPLEPRLLSSSFEVTQGVHEGPCPSGGIPPFHPQVISGTQNNAGGSYSPFYLRILRDDGEQELTRFSTTLPPGLTGNLTGIPFCPEAAIQLSKEKTGAQEEAEPSCPAASEIGHTIVSAGVGTVLAQTPGKVYLAGPYHGAPLSIVSVTSAKVGPFDLGTVVIRFALNINPSTAQVEVSANGSDPIPHIIKGIVVHVREIRVYMDKEKFILNPTNCNPLSITDTIDGAGADFTNPADQVPVAVNTPFEAADCQGLQFKPVFKVSTSGKTSRSGGASLAVKLTVPAALGTQANISRVKVDLPKQLPSRLTTLQKGCTAAQFNTNPAGCPAASVVGHAKAITPLIPVPLEGPAYFVSHGGEAFPSLIVVLQGYGFTIDLVGSTFISKAGITSSTFKTVPDQPVTSFELTLPEGKYSALAANGNLCKSKLTMPTEFVAQNGAKINESTPIGVTGCAKKKTLTRAQKLTAAMKACKKKAKGKRAACAAKAHKQFGPLKKKSKSR